VEKFARALGVSAFGVATSLATAIAVAAVARLTSFNAFTFSIWLVVPVGALLTGFAAASGYYFGSHVLHQRPSWHTLVQMVVIAAATNVLIYYFEYATLVLDNGVRASQIVSFPTYMRVYLSNQEISVGPALQTHTSIGKFGYWLAGLDFLGFLAGAVCIYFWLIRSQFCKTCEKYLRKCAQRIRYFGSADDAGHYYDGLFSNPVDSDAFLRQAKIGSLKVVTGSNQMMIKTTLLGCPKCKDQVWRDEVSGWNGKEWKELSNLERLIAIPSGTDLTAALNGPGSSP
jgi:hypothetical protein